MKPVADFTCLSKRCDTPEGAQMYELPIDAIRCPSCGSKRIRRLFNKVGVIGTRNVQPEIDSRLTSSSHLQRSVAHLQPGFDHAESIKPDYNRIGKSFAYSMTSGPGDGISHGPVGNAGAARPMKPVEIQQSMREDMAQHGMPVRIESLLAGLNRLSNSGPVAIPTEARVEKGSR